MNINDKHLLGLVALTAIAVILVANLPLKQEQDQSSIRTFDSIKGIEMSVALQEKYNIRIDDSIIPKLTNVKLVAEEVHRLLTIKNTG